VAELVEGQVALTTFDPAHGAAVDFGLQGEVFLRKPFLLSPLAKPLTGRLQ
jgi:hypothetical protein